MDLLRAFGIRSGETVALTGAGGKSNLMFALAQALPIPIVLTTTTHLGVWQAPLADHHLIVEPGDDFQPQFPQEFQTLLITGPADGNGRLTALDEASLQKLREICEQHGYTLLIEADGARQRPLKAPAEYEPVVPSWVNTVIVLAGMSALDEPLTDEWVHRPERFSKLSGLARGEPISVESIVTVLGSRQGGLRGLPENARRLLFLSQADSVQTQSNAQRIAQLLNDVYSDVLIGSLREPALEGPIFSVQSPVAGIVLAAGGSQRLGRPKQLLEWQGQAFLSLVIKNSLETGLAPLIVVTGADSDIIREEIADFPVKIVHNPDWQDGQSTSMKAGLAALPDGCRAAMLLLSDQPQISPNLIRQLIETWYQERKPITAPEVKGKRANPVLFGRETFDMLNTVTGDKGGRAVFDQFEIARLPWVDERVKLDVDNGKEYQRLIDSYSV
jgi:molybdenum cofactor cytidylyltransferase